MVRGARCKIQAHLEHGAGEAEVDTEDELDGAVVELVILEEHLHEEDPAEEKEEQLAGDDDDRVSDKLHRQIGPNSRLPIRRKRRGC